MAVTPICDSCRAGDVSCSQPSQGCWRTWLLAELQIMRRAVSPAQAGAAAAAEHAGQAPAAVRAAAVLGESQPGGPAASAGAAPGSAASPGPGAVAWKAAANRHVPALALGTAPQMKWNGTGAGHSLHSHIVQSGSRQSHLHTLLANVWQQAKAALTEATHCSWLVAHFICIFDMQILNRCQAWNTLPQSLLVPKHD